MVITETALKMQKELSLYPERFEIIDNKLKEWNRDEIQAINAIIMRDGIEVFNKSYGQADPNSDSFVLTQDTIFQMASITKPVIAALIMILSEDGELNLSDSVGTYVPEFAQDDKKDIALWHLLTHTSGILDDDMHNKGVEFLKNELNLEMTDETWESVVKKAGEMLKFDETDPGAIWTKIIYKQPISKPVRNVMVYSNGGYNILKNIIVKITGEKIDKYAARKIFTPLGMKNTYFSLPKEKWNNVIKRREGTEGYPWYNESGSYLHESGGGGLKSTAADIIKFCEMVRNNGRLNNARIMSPITVEGMLKNHNIENFTAYDAWALGWNYHGIKSDDMGIVRPECSVDHGGYGGSRIFIDRKNKISWAYLSVSPSELKNNVYAKFTNMVYSCFD